MKEDNRKRHLAGSAVQSKCCSNYIHSIGAHRIFFRGGELGVWRRKSPSGGVQGEPWLGYRDKPPEAKGRL